MILEFLVIGFFISFIIVSIYFTAKLFRNFCDECFDSCFLLGLFIAIFFIVLKLLSNELSGFLILALFVIVFLLCVGSKDKILEYRNFYMLSLSMLIFSLIFSFFLVFVKEFLFSLVLYLQSCILYFLIKKQKNKITLNENFCEIFFEIVKKKVILSIFFIVAILASFLILQEFLIDTFD